jgi:hypothetical protein
MIPREAVFFYELGDILSSEGATLEVFTSPSALGPGIMTPYVYLRCESLTSGGWIPRRISLASIKAHLSTLNTIRALVGSHWSLASQKQLMVQRRLLGRLADLLKRYGAFIETTAFSAHLFKLTVVLGREHAEFNADGFWDFDALDSKTCFEVAAKMEEEMTPGFYEALANSIRRIN